MMDDSILSESKPQETGVDAKLILKLTHLNVNKKIPYYVASSNNLSNILAKAQESYGPSVQIYNIYKDERLSSHFKDDQDMLDHLSAKGSKIYCSSLPPSQMKKTQSLVIGLPEPINQIKKQQSAIIVNETLTPASSMQIKIKKSVLKIKQQSPIKKEQEIKVETRAVSSPLVNNLHESISIILKSHHSELAQHFLPSQKNDNHAKFDLTCHFCHNNQLQERISVCEENLHIVACQDCSKYLAYQLPFPFKVYTSPQQYVQDRQRQPKEAEIHFEKLLQREKQQRNRRIRERLATIAHPC